jgi:hypothetical protein
MTYFVVGFLVLVTVFVVGFFVGKKHGTRVALIGQNLSDTIKKA